MIEPVVLADHEAMSRRAADWLAERIRRKPDALLCAASGSTPNRAYELFAEQACAEPSLAAHLRLVKLDEWGGLAMDDPSTCEAHLQRVLVRPLRLADRYVAFQSDHAAEAECARVADWLRIHGPLDLCVLGLGLNGHLGFNEPADVLRPHAHVATLSTTSLKHAMLGERQQLPTHGITLGMADLLQAREIVLLVSGAAKRGPVRRLLQGDITTHFPASFLQLHRHVTLLCDAAAAS